MCLVGKVGMFGDFWSDDVGCKMLGIGVGGGGCGGICVGGDGVCVGFVCV